MTHDPTGPTVLLADSDAAALWSVRKVLERDGFEIVAEARNADEAIEAALQHRPAVCLLEAELPGDALGVTSRLYAALPATRIAMLANSEAIEDALAAIRAGANGYLLRRTSLDRLGPALRAVARGEVAVPRACTAVVFGDLREKRIRARPAYGWLNRTILYVPRFVRHLRRRLRSRMTFADSWRSTRVRMRDYAQARVVH